MEGEGGNKGTGEQILALPQSIVRGLGDRSYEKRKGAALEVEALVKALAENNDQARVEAVLSLLGQDLCTSSNSNHRKGGLHGLAAAAIGLLNAPRIKEFLPLLLPPILHCFDDHESRVRYYACESLYNVAKVARQEVLPHFHAIFEGLCKLFADGDPDVKNGAQLLDRLIKDIVTESDLFDVEKFIPLLQKYIRRTNPYIRILLVGWITVLDQVPDMNLLDWLPDFLDGLFNMLADDNKEIRQAAEKCLAEFMREIQASSSASGGAGVGASSVDFGAMVPILTHQCSKAKDRFIRLTAVCWLRDFIRLAWPQGLLVAQTSDLLEALLHATADPEDSLIRQEAERTSDELLCLVRDLSPSSSDPASASASSGAPVVLDYAKLLTTLTTQLPSHHVPTRLSSLRWIKMLLEKAPQDMATLIDTLLPPLIKTLSDASDEVVLLNLHVLARIALLDRSGPEQASLPLSQCSHFLRLLHAVVHTFQHDRRLLEHRGSLVVRQLCVLLDAQHIYLSLAKVLQEHVSGSVSRVEEGGPLAVSPVEGQGEEGEDLDFVAMMVQTLNLILLTATELSGLRSLLKASFNGGPPDRPAADKKGKTDKTTPEQPPEKEVFLCLFECWSHNPVATLSLCLLAQAYGLAARLVQEELAHVDITVGFLMQVDKLVQLLESPIFLPLRLHLLDASYPLHHQLLTALYGVLMILPQSSAYRTLSDRLLTVSTHHSITHAAAHAHPPPPHSAPSKPAVSGVAVGASEEEISVLLASFRHVQARHAHARASNLAKRSLIALHAHSANAGTPGALAFSAGRPGAHP